jgi:hypothetical protein
MGGWIVPPPDLPVRREADLRCEREAKVAELVRRGSCVRSACAARCSPYVARTSSRRPTGTTPTRRFRFRSPASGRRSPARTAIRCSTSRLVCRKGTGSSRWAWAPVTGRRWRGRWWARAGSLWPSISTRQRSRSRARTWSARATPTTSSLSMATGDSAPRRTPPTTGSASPPHAPPCRRRSSSSSRNGAGSSRRSSTATAAHAARAE